VKNRNPYAKSDNGSVGLLTKAARMRVDESIIRKIRGGAKEPRNNGNEKKHKQQLSFEVMEKRNKNKSRQLPQRRKWNSDRRKKKVNKLNKENSRTEEKFTDALDQKPPGGIRTYGKYVDLSKSLVLG